MKCEVCGQELDASDPDLSYCFRCGWPLGRFSAAWESAAAILVADAPELVELSCRNEGPGQVRARFLTATEGVKPSGPQCQELLLDNRPRKLSFLVDPPTLEQGAASLRVVFSVTDRRGRHARDYRPTDMSAAERECELLLPLQRRQTALHCYQDCLIFQPGRRQRQLQLQNPGDVPLQVLLTAADGYQLRMPGGKGDQRLALTIPPGNNTEEVLVDAPQQGGNSTISLTVPRSPALDCTIAIRWIPEEEPEPPRYRWVIGLDFGTAKSAAFVLDNHVPDAEPVPITWPEKPGKERFKVPSVIQYRPNRQVPEFGWQVTDTAEADERLLVLRSIKSHLREDREYHRQSSGIQVTSRQVVRDYINCLVTQIARHPLFAGQRDPFADAQVVMSLPVLDHSQQMELQEALTRDCAAAAGLRTEEDRLLFFPEPECAAVDFLRHRSELGLEVQDEDLILVYDGGAGTTDLCVLEVHLSNGLSFTRRALVGFPFGGDVLDELLTRHFINNWQEAGLIDSYEAGSPNIVNKKDGRAVSRLLLRSFLRELKERLGYPSTTDAEAASREVKSSFAGLPVGLSQGLLDELFTPYIERMLSGGFQERDEIPDWSPGQREPRRVGCELPSLEEALWEADIKSYQIRWVCLTGGGSFIPSVARTLQHAPNPPARLIPSVERLPELAATPDSPVTLNVARGAPCRPGYRVVGRLPVDYFLQLVAAGRESERVPVLARGAAPGAPEREVPFPLGPGQEGVLRLVALVEGVPCVVYAFPVRKNRHDATANVLARVEYAGDLRIYLTVDLAARGGKEPRLPRTPVA